MGSATFPSGDDAVPLDHPVRAIDAVIAKLDLEPFYLNPLRLRSHLGASGAWATEPRLKLALWVYATSEGISSARELADLCLHHDAYRWLCGGVPIKYRCLSKFRMKSGRLFDDLVTKVLALLMQHSLVELHRIAQDGTRIRASAGAASFRRGASLDELMPAARAHLEAVTREGQDPVLGARRQAAHPRAAQDRVARLEAALAQLPEVTAIKKKSGAKDTVARVSTTDPDARVMKMARGWRGFRPAGNVQFATTADAARVIVGFDVTKAGSDMGQTTPMIAQVERRTGARPKEVLVDGGYTKLDAIDEAAALDVTILAPIPRPRVEGVDPHAPRPGDSPAVVEWRTRMATDEAKEAYKDRAAVAETVNAEAKDKRGLDRLRVRGLDKVTTVITLFALTYNILRFIALTTT
jgi:transposase